MSSPPPPTVTLGTPVAPVVVGLPLLLLASLTVGTVVVALPSATVAVGLTQSSPPPPPTATLGMPVAPVVVGLPLLLLPSSTVGSVVVASPSATVFVGLALSSSPPSTVTLGTPVAPVVVGLPLLLLASHTFRIGRSRTNISNSRRRTSTVVAAAAANRHTWHARRARGRRTATTTAGVTHRWIGRSQTTISNSRRRTSTVVVVISVMFLTECVMVQIVQTRRVSTLLLFRTVTASTSTRAGQRLSPPMPHSTTKHTAATILVHQWGG